MTHLEQLLIRLRDGVTASPADLERAAALVRSDERIPAELREIVFADPEEAAADAAGVLALLGADDLGELIASAILAEAGPLFPEDLPGDIPGDLVGDIVAAIATVPDGAPDAVEAPDDDWAPIGLALAEGLRREAEGFEIADAVMRHVPLADFGWGPVLADAVSTEAGTVDVAGGVLAALDRREMPVAAAVWAEAGTVDVADAVMSALGIAPAMPAGSLAAAVRAEAGTVDVTEAVMSLVAPPRRAAGGLPAANNHSAWAYRGLALAAAALLTIVVGRSVIPGAAPAPSEVLVFAQAGDVVVEDLSYGDDVVVLQTAGDQEAVILWLDEEA